MFKPRPGLIIVASFMAVIFAGSILLSLPISSSKGESTNFLDSYFTSNSATCVTGLVTLDTGTHFSLFGMIVIMVLMQVGGLGYMTFSTLIALILRQKLSISQKLTVQEALNIYSTKDVVFVLKKIFGVVFVIEGIGALILLIRWLPDMGIQKSLLYAVFHSISAFNNAGFALFPNFANLMPYASDLTVNLTITSLIIMGGVGFVVIADLLGRRRKSLHSKIVISTTVFLLILGTLAFLYLEFNNPQTLGPLNLKDKILVSYFHSVTPRTAGFNTVDTGKIIPPTALLTMLLMFIGASPGGTGGGVKTSTFALIFSTIWATLKGSKNTIMFGRRIPAETVRRAFTITFLALTVISLSIFLLDKMERFSLMEISFEVISAFGTVGLSLGITPHLSSAGKILIILVMFIGRVGPLSLLLALTLDQKEPRIIPPKEEISIG